MIVFKYFISALALLCVSGLVMAEKVAVIVNAENKQSLGRADLTAIYSDNVITWANGNSIHVYDLPVKNESREIFSRSVLGMSGSDAAKEWANRKITNTARNPPKTKNERLVLLSVKKDVNAIGYVLAGEAEGKEGIKILMTIE